MNKTAWFSHGDLDGFFGLFVDNLTQLMLIAVMCRYACGFPNELIVERILPAVGASVLVGNLFYSWQARKLAEATGQTNVTALPFGINTVSLLAFIFLVMSPVYNETGNANAAWKAGLVMCFMSGIIETAGAFVGAWIKRHTPRAALLSGLAGVALAFIGLGFSLQVFSSPGVALVPMLLVLFLYASRVQLPFRIPVGVGAMLLGGILAWTLKFCGFSGFQLSQEPLMLSFHLPLPAFTDLFPMLFDAHSWRYIAVGIPVALFNVIGSIQNLESAHAAGDEYAPKPALLVNGGTSLLASLLGSPFPTSIYIGHPGWKLIGARSGYSTLNGIVIAALCFFGGINALLKIMPIEATLGILIWIGVVMVSEAFSKTERNQLIAVVIGLIPPLGAWALSLIESTLRVAGTNLYDIYEQFRGEIYIDGVLSLYQGFLLISIILSAAIAHSINRKFISAALWCFVGAVLSAVGLIHAYEITPNGIHPSLHWMAAPWFCFSYTTVGLFLLALNKLPIPVETER